MDLRPDVVRLGVAVLLSVVVTLVFWLAAPGLFGLDEDLPATTKVTATVTKGESCGQAGDGEAITFIQDGKKQQAKLDGCGHQDGESLDVNVPVSIDLRANGNGVVVHAAEAATGESDSRRPLAFVLFLLSCFAGGGFAFLYVKRLKR